MGQGLSDQGPSLLKTIAVMTDKGVDGERGKTMKGLKNFASRLWKDESAQGATEYILLLVAVVAVLVVFRQRIISAIQNQIGVFEGNMQQFNQGQ